MIRRVLVPLDGSARAESALPHAMTVARAFGADLHLLRVVEGPASEAPSIVDSLAWRVARGEAASYLRAIVERLEGAGHSVQGQVAEGRAADQIVQFIGATGIDLVVLTTHGTGAAVDFELGATVRKAMEKAGVSVMLVPSRLADEPGPEPIRYGRILVGVDCSRRAEWALCLAAIVARAERAELVVTHVVRIPETASAGEPERRLAQDLVTANRLAATAYLDRVTARLRGPDLRVRTRLDVGGSVADALAAALAEEAPDLTILCAHGATGDETRPFGSVAQRFLGSSHGVIAVLQDLPHPAGLAAESAPQRTGALPAIT